MLKLEDLRKNETYYLKKEIILYKEEDANIKLDVGTPLLLLKKGEVCTFNVMGAFLTVSIFATSINLYLSTFIDNLNRKD